jgi:predicted  nucleic acid-binding Zn-ribbon protein
MNTAVKQNSHLRYLWLVALIGLPALSWSGILDQFSSENINASISSAGLIYGTARGINALVSLLQGTELNVPFVTFSVGEVLDPVNDLIERFSDIVLLALGSLALQKILLSVVSNTMFTVLLSLVAVCTGLSLFLGGPKLRSALLRTFLVIAFFRFSLGLVVLANSWVDSTFLDEADQQRHVAMEKFQGELRQIDTLSRREAEAETRLAELTEKRVQLENDHSEAGSALAEFNAQVTTAESKFDEVRSKAGVFCKISDIFGTCPEEVKRAKAELDKAEAKRSAAAERLASIDAATDSINVEMDCLAKHSRGENCSFWDSVPDAPDAAALRGKLNAINAELSDFTENSINLLMSLLLKTVAIPLLFILLLLKIAQLNWGRI